MPKPNAVGNAPCLLPGCTYEIEVRRNTKGDFYYFCPGERGGVGCNGSVKFGDLADPREIPGFKPLRKEPAKEPAPPVEGGERNVTETPAPEPEKKGDWFDDVYS